jgi:thiol-disulfide isomerase/thioredoxin
MFKRLAPIAASLAVLTALSPALSIAEDAVPAKPAVAVQPKPAAAGILKPGDPAPPLALGKWVKGEPVTEFAKGQTYIVECWATWCGPCIVAIPHVSELQAKYKDKGLTVIGVDVWDEKATDEKVSEFVEKQGEKMNYRVVRDDLSDPAMTRGKMATTWLVPAGQNGIPCSFIINKEGKIAWIGHPMRLDSVLPKVLDGSFDIAKEAESFTKTAEANVKMAALSKEYTGLVKEKDFDGAMKKLDEMAQVKPEMAEQYQVQKVSLLINSKADYKEGNALAAKLADTYKDNARLLGALATLLARPPTGVKPASDPRDLPLALKTAQRAVELSRNADSGALAALAAVQFELGEIDKAIEAQTKAVELAPANAKRFYQQNLDKYAAAKK